MKTVISSPPVSEPRRSSVLPLVGVGLGTFVVGAALAFGFVQYQAQQAQMAVMSKMIEQMSEGQAEASRNASLDLLAVTNAAISTQPAPQIEEVVAVAPEPVAAPSTAERIRALANIANDPNVSAAIAADRQKRESMSLAIQGIKILSEAAMSGNYTVTIEPNADGDDRLRLNFADQQDIERDLEDLLARAGAAGDIALHDAVVTSDGSIDPKTMIFDLVERTLRNGSPEEVAAADELQRRAAALGVATAEVVGGEKFYTVEGGDSLAYIALKFYGNTNAYYRIFEANRNILSAPDRIQIGQRLLIPSA